ncbi:MAG: hypothetical protein QXS81_04820 [Candidatus Micrarchaeaceae archaeon]
MASKLDNSFLCAMKKSFQAYNSKGARSNEKLIPIHTWLANEIEQRLGTEYSVKSVGHGGESQIEGKYYPKREDITISIKQTPIVVLSFKFVTSNYAQNSNNYFENLLGETANIRRVGVGFAHFLVLRGHTPYYDKAAGNKRGKQKKIEVLEGTHLMKYVKLFRDVDFPHKPDILGMAILDFNRDQPYFTNLDELELTDEIKKIITDEFSLQKFLDRVVALCKLKT